MRLGLGGRQAKAISLTGARQKCPSWTLGQLSPDNRSALPPHWGKDGRGRQPVEEAMNTILFRERFPNLMPMYSKAARGDAPIRYLLARYDDAMGHIQYALRGYFDGAKAGHASSMYYLGMHYYSNKIKSEENRKAIRLFIRAAHLGEVKSQEEYELSGLESFEPYFSTGAESAYMAGEMFENGRGERSDAYEAFYYYEMGIEQAGHLGCILALASLYRRGIGTKRDVEKAAALLRQAADRQSSAAYYALGMMHERFGELDEDPAEAADCYWEAARRGHPDAAFRLAQHLAEGKGIEQNLMGALLWAGWAEQLGDNRSKKQIESLLPRLTAEEIAQARDIFSKARANFASCGLFESEG